MNYAQFEATVTVVRKLLLLIVLKRSAGTPSGVPRSRAKCAHSALACRGVRAFNERSFFYLWAVFLFTVR